MKITAATVDDYVSQLPEDRQVAITKLRAIFNNNLSGNFEECMSYNMIGYVIPHSQYPEGYHCDPKLPLPFINIASQKNFIAIYHMGIYANKDVLDWFVSEYPKHSKRKLDMGKSCVRFKKMDDIPYELITELALKMSTLEWIEIYERVIKP